jgi:replication-associated recombination protein RarA
MQPVINSIVEESNGDARSCLNRVQIYVTSKNYAKTKAGSTNPSSSIIQLQAKDAF